MNAATQELLSLLQSGAHDEDCLGRIRIFATGSRKDLIQTADRDTLGDLHSLLRAWAESAPPELGAQALALAAEIAEDDLADSDLAIGDYDRALELAPDVEVTRALADAYARRGTDADRQEAAELYAAVGEVLGADGGVDVLERALQLRPTHEGALDAAEALLAQEPRRLVPHWERYLEAAGESGAPDAVAQRRLSLGRAYDEEERYRDAMLVIAPLVDRNDPQALMLRDVLLAKLENESDQAVPTFEPTQGLRPRSGNTMVGFKLPTGDVDEAVARAKAVVAQKQSTATTPTAATPAATSAAGTPAATPTTTSAAATPAVSPVAQAVRASKAASPRAAKRRTAAAAVRAARAAQTSPAGAPATTGFEPTQPSLPHPTIDPAHQQGVSRPPTNPFAPSATDAAQRSVNPLTPAAARAVDPRANTAPSMPYASAVAADAIAGTAPSMPHAAPASTPSSTPALDTQDRLPFVTRRRSPKPWIIGAAVGALAVGGIVWASSGGDDDATDAAEATHATAPPAAEAEPTPEPPAKPATAEPSKPAAAAEPEPPTAKPDPPKPPTKPRAPKRSTKKPASGKVGVALSLMRVRGGTLTREELDKATSKAKPKLQSCYDAALKRNPKVEGRIVLEWTVNKGGKVSGVRKSRDTARDAKLYQCVAGVVRVTKFASPEGGSAKVRLPFDFEL